MKLSQIRWQKWRVMSKTNAWAMDEADKKIDQAVKKVKEGYDRQQAIKELLADSNISGFFDDADLDMIFEFEIDNTTTHKTKQ